MTIRILLAALVAATALPAAAVAQPAPAAAVAEDLVRVALDTDKGRIVLALDRGRAPVTTANFLAYVEKGWLDGQPFYRAFKYGSGGIIQAGVRDGAKQLPPIKHEPTSVTGLKNVAWTVALANRGPGTARSDFFIMTADVPAFDAKGSEIGFAAFGRVVEGKEVVEAILAAPTSPTKGEGVMRGQMLEPAVLIRKAARVKAP
ncbi:peptidylprolyl isomerase [Sphingomonas mesophila]|uniref:peptidylprolyl isomerase n=1 Tax=Sphingomonas mesophila TaxID=2303576 RepID=UPI000E591381|nr:peptidylprolyl isomerase [Sphingomonas mesophila]